MTVIRPNSISGITSLTAHRGSIDFYAHDGSAATFNNINSNVTSGVSTFASLNITGDLTVDGTTTTLDTVVTEVDRLEVSANSTVAAGIITQTGSGDILRLFDGASEVFSVADGGAVKIGGAGQLALDVSYDGSSATAAKIVTNTGITNANSTFTFAVNENSGAQMQLKGDGAVIFSEGSTERLRIDSAGKIGIGTVSPSGSIHAHVASGTQRSYLEASAAHSFLRLKSGSTSYNSGLEFFSGASNIANINGLGAGDLQFEVNGSERLRIASDGQATFDKGAPGSSNQVIARFQAESSRRLDIVWHDSGSLMGFDTPSSHSYIFKVGGSEKLRLDSSNRLLLGTTTEGYDSADNFTIADTGNCGLTIRSATNGLGTIAFSDATSGTGEYSGFIQYNQANRHLTFGTESLEQVRIDNNGHLEVDYDGSNNARVQFGFASGVWITGNQSDGHQRFYTNQNVRILSGYNGQGTEFHNQNSVRPGADNAIDLGSGSYRYDDIYATNGTIQTSDSRLKQEVVTSVLGIDFVKALRPVSYKWIEGKKVPIVDGTDENGDNTYRTDDNGNWDYESRAGARRHWGFIAQEVKQVVDDAGVDFAGWTLVDKDDPDSTQSLRYEEFIAPLTKALQEAITKIEALEAAVAELQGS